MNRPFLHVAARLRIVLVCLALIAAVLSPLAVRSARAALQADELLLIVNANIPASVKSAEFYAKARLVPDGRILALNLPASEEIPFDRYEQEFVPAVRQFIIDNNLRDKVKCLVPFFGVPFRIGGKALSQEEKDEAQQVRQQLDVVVQQVLPAVREMEAIAQELNPRFVTVGGQGPGEVVTRAEAALQSINRSLPKADDPRHVELLPKLLKLMRQFGGDAQIAGRLNDAEIAAVLGPEEAKRWPGRREQLAAASRDAEQLQEKRHDPAARKKLREIVADGFGAFGQIGLLNAQFEYLSHDGTVSALDNELALLWWNYYSRARYLPNPLHYRYDGQTPPVLMVSRLDGPQEGTAMQIILSSLKAEKEGLKGRVVIDSTGGLTPDGKFDQEGGYRRFDQKLLNLSEIIRTKTSLPMTMDKQPPVLPPNSVNDVAIYCGWYSVRNYVPSCRFVPGAVGYHVASFEMVSLRADNEKGWVAGLLNDGIAATTGAVAEPYLSAFPSPDEFFPLLLTGELTLAEVYWKTLPMTSWMMVLVGDPLYVPYKTNPALKVEDLPAPLRRAIDGSKPAPAALFPRPPQDTPASP